MSKTIIEQTQTHPDKDKGYELGHLKPEVNYRPEWGRRSAEFRAATPCRLDLSYGHGPRGHLDFFPAAHAAESDTLIFIHGGYWQKGDKSFYSFVAQPFVERGVSCVLLNYDFCPSVRISDITAQIQAAMTWLWRNGRELGISTDKLHISGHSAGAHLAAMMATTDWSAQDASMPNDLLKSAALISGIFDLEPLLQVPDNQVLKLDAQEAGAQSPIRRELAADIPQLVVCGEWESDEFHRQSDLYTARFNSGGRRPERYNVKQCNHFDVVDHLANPETPLFEKVLEMIRSAR